MASFSEGLGFHQLVDQSQLIGNFLTASTRRELRADVHPSPSPTSYRAHLSPPFRTLDLPKAPNYHPFLSPKKMVCVKCQKSQKKTELATPGVKRKNDMYFGSPASHDKSKSLATSSASGIGKVS